MQRTSFRNSYKLIIFGAAILAIEYSSQVRCKKIFATMGFLRTCDISNMFIEVGLQYVNITTAFTPCGTRNQQPIRNIKF
jgi:hypothetical protein